MEINLNRFIKKIFKDIPFLFNPERWRRNIDKHQYLVFIPIITHPCWLLFLPTLNDSVGDRHFRIWKQRIPFDQLEVTGNITDTMTDCPQPTNIEYQCFTNLHFCNIYYKFAFYLKYVQTISLSTEKFCLWKYYFSRLWLMRHRHMSLQRHRAVPFWFC